MDYAKLDALIEARRDEFLKDLGRWLSIPSVQGAAEEGAPFGRENRRMLDLALEDARGYGFATRMFDGYPQTVRDLMNGMFVVDGEPMPPMKKQVTGALKSVGVMNLVKDARGVMKAL